MKQERDLLLTTEKIYNIKKKYIQRSINIKYVQAFTKNKDQKDLEFVVHVKNEYDYQFICPARDELITSMKAVYFMKLNKNLPIYEYPDALKKIATSKKEASAGQDRIPSDEYRLHEEDIYEPLGSANSKASMSTQGSSESDDEF
jgi:hypothetical protein